MMKEPEKYLPGGGLNPFWVEWDCARIRKEEDDEIAQERAEYLLDLLDSIQIVEEDDMKGGIDDSNNSELNTLEQKLQFLLAHKYSEEEFRLAKQLLGIKE